ncbi:MAG: glycosyltransferase [Acidimicrobiia bacterium]|nr:glycosyltransferase [Acidimicrobiia bacterium]
MRVLHVVGSLDAHVGGSTAAGVETAAYLRQLGVDAAVAGSWESPTAADYIRDVWPDLPVHGFGRRPPHHYWNSPTLRSWLRSAMGEYDVVCVHGLFKFPFVDAARTARRRRVPYLVQPHSSLDPYDLQKHSSLKAVFGPLVVRPMLRNAAGVLVTTERERDRLMTWGAAPDVQVLPLPVSAPSTAGDGRRFRAAHNIDTDAKVLLFLSRLHRKKGLERLFRAAARVSEGRGDVVLAIAGTGRPEYEQQLRDEAATVSGATRVLWLGHLTGDAKWDAFAAADVFVLPSENENFGIVLLEALMARTPAVVSHEVYLSDELADFVTVCALDVDAVERAVTSVLDDPDAARTRADKAREFVVERYHPVTVARRTLALYENVIARRPIDHDAGL